MVSVFFRLVSVSFQFYFNCADCIISEHCVAAVVSSTGEEDDDELQRSDSKPAQVKRRQSVFSKLGSTRLKKVWPTFSLIVAYTVCVSRLLVACRKLVLVSFAGTFDKKNALV